MPAEVTALDLRLRRRSLLGYTAGIVVYAFVVVAIYPAFKDDTSLNQFTKNGNAVAALFGANGPLTTPAGWLNANLYANFVPLIVLLLTIGYGASALAGQDEDGTLSLITTLPLSRRRLVADKLAALTLQAVPVSLATMLCVLIGHGFGLSVSTNGLIGVTLGVVLLGIDFGALALAIGAATGSRGTALGISSATAALCYLISSLAPVVHWLHPARYASPFFYAVGDGQLNRGLSPTDAIVLLTVAAALSISAVAAFDRLDVH
ncbi:MAG: ABC transporter permease [Pseudonocardiales bacterium]|nr:MAG: ABC transporter permease [Pseudonocardiales bacterium]